MFKVKATLVNFIGDEERYPCHFGHKIGDEIIFDGEKYIGRLCPDVWPMLTQKAVGLHAAGPRYIQPEFYYPFHYVPCSVKDPSKKKYDGRGFRNVLETRVEPKYHMATLVGPDASKWPPHTERTVFKDITVMCPDIRTAAVFKLEAVDLSEKGFDIPYFRRQMVILHKVLPKPGIEVDNILNEFSKAEIEEIYPALGSLATQALVEELEILNYLEIRDGKAYVTKKGEAKLEDFKAGLPKEEREALGL